MLTYRAHKNLREFTEGECSRIVVYNDNGDPVAVVIQLGNDKYLAANIGDKSFDSILEAFNIEKLKFKNE